VVRERRVSSAVPRSAAIEHRGRSARASRLNASLDRMTLDGLVAGRLLLPARRSRTQRPRARAAPSAAVQFDTTASTAAAGATPRQTGPAAGYGLSSRAHELSSNGVELLPKAGQPQPSPRAGVRRAP
jgi:hypothetical protein